MSSPKASSPMAAAVQAGAKGLKGDKKSAKADRRAQRVATGGGAGPSTPNGTLDSSTPNTQPLRNPATAGPSRNAGSKAAPEAATTAVAADPLQLFLHLDLPSSSSNLSHSSEKSTASIHPSIIRLALQYAEFKVVGANARCIALLEALKDVIGSYTPPSNTILTRHLPTTHLNPQISHLIRARPLSVSMGAAIRYLKYEISLIDESISVDEARALLTQKIDSFIRDRILLADKVIEQHAIAKINDGDTILTYARSSVVEGVLLEAKRQGKEFTVVVVDSRPLYEGENLLASLLSAGIPVTYILLPSLAIALPRVSLCLLGTNALLSNGSMFARAGTAMVAMMLRSRAVPVVCCCETYKFSERIMLDSIVGNEMAASSPLLEGLTPPFPNLSPLSLLYDVARPEDVTAVITEAGLVPVQSVPVVLRDYKPLLSGA